MAPPEGLFWKQVRLVDAWRQVVTEKASPARRIPRLSEEPSTVVLRALRHPRYRRALQENMFEALAATYEAHVWRAFETMKALDTEVRHTIYLLARATSPVRFRSLMKQYIISWNTMSDLSASYLNEVFDLGLSERDVRLSVVLRNKHVRRTRVANVLKKHARAIRHDEFQRLRNDIVHRGRLSVPGTEEIHRAETRLQLSRLFEPDSLPADRQCEVSLVVETAAKTSARELCHHYAATVRMLNELAHESLRVIESHLRQPRQAPVVHMGTA